MKYEFIDEKKVIIKASIPWKEGRPPLDSREVVKKDVFIEKFCKENPEYIIESIEGPNSLCNFGTQEKAQGEWVVYINKKSKPKAVRKPRTYKKKTTEIKKEGV